MHARTRSTWVKEIHCVLSWFMFYFFPFYFFGIIWIYRSPILAHRPIFSLKMLGYGRPKDYLVKCGPEEEHNEPALVDFVCPSQLLSRVFTTTRNKGSQRADKWDVYYNTPVSRMYNVIFQVKSKFHCKTSKNCEAWKGTFFFLSKRIT